MPIDNEWNPDEFAGPREASVICGGCRRRTVRLKLLAGEKLTKEIRTAARCEHCVCGAVDAVAPRETADEHEAHDLGLQHVFGTGDANAFAEAGDQLNALLWWILTGGKRDVAETERARIRARALRNPSVIGRRIVAFLFCVRPEMLGHLPLRDLAATHGGKTAALSNLSQDFLDRFPTMKGPRNKNTDKLRAARKRHRKR